MLDGDRELDDRLTDDGLLELNDELENEPAPTQHARVTTYSGNVPHAPE
jgi:hypothetical protein